MADTESTEVWRPVRGFEAFYTVSSFGAIRSLRFKRLMCPHADVNGYRSVMLRGYDPRVKARLRRLHHVVLEAFVGPCPAGHQTAHLDGHPENNRLDNLAWVTPKENASHKKIHGTENDGSRNGWSKLTEADVIEIRRLRVEGVPRAVLCERFGLTPDHLGKIATGEQWKHVAGSSPRTGRPKLTETDAAEIRRLHADGVNRHVIAERFGVVPDHVNVIVRGRRWA